MANHPPITKCPPGVAFGTCDLNTTRFGEPLTVRTGSKARANVLRDQYHGKNPTWDTDWRNPLDD